MLRRAQPLSDHPRAVKHYREGLHLESAEIRAAESVGQPLRDARTGRRARTLSNESINKTLRLLAVILDDAEEEGWIDRNVARGRRMREPRERRKPREALEVDEFVSLIEAAAQLDSRHASQTLKRAARVRELRDEVGLAWKEIAFQLSVGYGTAVYLYNCAIDPSDHCGPRQAVVATLTLTGLRVTELCEAQKPRHQPAQGAALRP